MVRDPDIDGLDYILGFVPCCWIEQLLVQVCCGHYIHSAGIWDKCVSNSNRASPTRARAVMYEQGHTPTVTLFASITE